MRRLLLVLVCLSACVGTTSGQDDDRDATDEGEPGDNGGDPQDGGDTSPNDNDPDDGDPGPFIPPACAPGSSASLPANAPTLIPGEWKDISPVTFGTGAAFTQGMTIDPCNPATIYVCVHGDLRGLYRSLDAGATWTEIGDFGGCLNVRVDPEDPLHLYVGSGVRGGTDGFFVSHDGGETFTKPAGFITASAVSGEDVYHVAPDPTDFQHVLVSFHYRWKDPYGENAGVIESFDGGDTWTLHPPFDNWGYGGAVFFLYEPSLGIGNANTWLFGSQGTGFYRTTNAGASWTQVSETPMTHGGGQLYYTQSGVLYMTTQHNLQRSTDNGITWTELGENGAFLGIIGDGTRLYAGQHGGGHFRTALESADTSWSNFNSQTFLEGPFEMVMDPVNRIIYSANISGGVFALKVE